jgi:hypothetical protein
MQTIKSIVRSPWGDCHHLEPPGTARWKISRISIAPCNGCWGRKICLELGGRHSYTAPVLDAANRYSTPPTDTDMQTMVDRLEMQSLFS